MGRRAVCYVADKRFFLPTILSAVSMRKSTRDMEMPIIIFTVGCEDMAAGARSLLKRYRISCHEIGTAYFDNYKDGFARSHVSISALGRLFLADLLPESYESFLYIDGDTWLQGNSNKLFNAHIEDGKIAACEDMLSFRAAKDVLFDKHNREYMRKLGLSIKSGYFNSGVILTGRSTWSAVSRDALDFLASNIAVCRFHDQSALNAVIGDRRVPISLRWNFQTPFKSAGFEHIVLPVILHFTRSPKPWMTEHDTWVGMNLKYNSAIEDLGLNGILWPGIGDGAEFENQKLNVARKVLKHSKVASTAFYKWLGCDKYERSVQF